MKPFADFGAAWEWQVEDRPAFAIQKLKKIR